MKLHINPGIVWALDDDSEQIVRAWYRDLDQKAVNFFRVATTWEQVRDYVTEFNTVGFSDLMLESGLVPNPAGRMLNVVFVGYAMGSERVRTWVAAQERLAQIERNVQSIDRRAILLARPGNHSITDRVLQAAGLEMPTWILSTRASNKEALSESDFQRLLCHALDCLVLSERTPSGQEEPAGAFFDTSVRSDAGRLIGVPVRSLEHLMAQYVAVLLASLAVRALDGLAEASLNSTNLQNCFWDRQRTFLRGEMSGHEYVDRVLRIDLPESVPFHLLTGDLRSLFQQLADGLEIEVRRLATAPASTPNHPAPSLFQRIADFLRKLFGVAPASERPLPKALRHVDAEYALVALRQAGEYLSTVRARVDSWRDKGGSTSGEVSQDLLRSWTNKLSLDTLHSLRGSKNGDLMLKRIGDVCREYARDNFGAEIEATGTGNGRWADIRRSMQNGHFLRFSAATLSPPRCASAVTNIAFLPAFKHGGDHVTVTRLMHWPGRPPFLLGVSDPVRFSDFQG